MVRAAAAGAIDYSRADPRDLQWQIKHKFVLEELARQERYDFFKTIHAQWLAYIGHGNLNEQSFKTVKTQANDLLQKIESAVFGKQFKEKTTTDKNKTGKNQGKKQKAKKAVKNDTILDPATAELVSKYKELREKGEI